MRRFGRRAPEPERGPAVSVVVPFWGVERYLAACLDSLLAQTYADFEAILVDDGSPDGSRAIADAYAARDPRLRVVARANGGLGAARNTGVREALGRWLTFLDSDDLLPPGALAALVAAGEASGSDVVVGAVERFGPDGTWIPPWVDEVHARDLRGLRLAEAPGLLRNLYTWNKLYRHDVWRDHDLWFREGVSYEDQPLVTQVLARARAIDVLTEPVYRWRLREDESSISQQKASLADLADRVAAWRAGAAVLPDELDGDLYDAWLATLADTHLQWYLATPDAEDAEPGFWATLVAAARELLGDAPASVWAATAPAHRVLLRLALDDRRADAVAFVAAGGLEPERHPARPAGDGGGLLLDLPLHGDPALPEHLFVLRPEQARVRHLVERIAWVDDGRGPALRVEGWAFLRHVDLAAHEQRVTVSLRGPGGRVDAVATERPVAAMPPPPPPPPHRGGPSADHRPGRFGALLDVGPLLEEVDRDGPPGGWTLWVRVEVPDLGLAAECPVSRVVRAGGGALLPALLPAPATHADPPTRVATDWRWGRPFRFRADRRVAPAVVRAVADGVVVEVPDGSPVVEVRLGEGPWRPPGSALPVPGRGRGPWRLTGRTGPGRRVDLVGPVPAPPAPVPADGVEVSRARSGGLVVTRPRPGTVVDDPAVLLALDLPVAPGDHDLVDADGEMLLVGPALLPLLPLPLGTGEDGWTAGRIVRAPSGSVRVVRLGPRHEAM